MAGAGVWAQTAPATAKQTPTLANLLCAIQERHMVVQQKEALWEISWLDLQQGPTPAHFRNSTDFVGQVELTPIDWGDGIPDFPVAGDIPPLSMEERVDLLHRASIELDRLKIKYLNLNEAWLQKTDVPDIQLARNRMDHRDLPSVVNITPESYLQKLTELSVMVQRLRLIGWEPLTRGYYSGAAYYDNNLWHRGFHGVPGYGFEFTWGLENPPDPIPALQSSPFTPLIEADPLTFLQELVQLVDEDYYWYFWNQRFAHLGTNPPLLQREFEWGPNDTEPDKLFPGNAEATGIIYQYDIANTLHEKGIGGELHKVAQLLETVRGPNLDPLPVDFMPDHQEQAPGWAKRSSVVQEHLLFKDPLVFGIQGQSVAFRFGDQDLQWDVSNGEFKTTMPVYDDPRYADLPNPIVFDDEGWPVPGYDEDYFWIYMYNAEYTPSAIFKPDFKYLTEPLPWQGLGPGDTGGGGPSPEGTWADWLPFAIQLGDGNITRGSRGYLAATFAWDGGYQRPAFHIDFQGIANEYDLDQNPGEEDRTYTGGLVETKLTVSPNDENHITVTQTLLSTPAGLSGPSEAGQVIRTFLFVKDLEASPATVNVTATYSAVGKPDVVRHWRLTYERELNSDDRLVKTVQQISALNGETVTARWTREDHTVWSTEPDKPVTVYQTELNSHPVRTQRVKYASSPRFIAPPASITTTSHTEPAETRTQSFTYHSNGLVATAAWDGPGAGTATFDTNGILLSSGQTTGPFSATSPGLSGNSYATTTRHETNDLRTSVFQRVADDEFTLTDSLPSDGTSTTVHLWDPTDAGTPAGQVPWGVKQIDHPDGTETHITDVLNTSGRIQTVFHRKQINGQATGTKTVRNWNSLGVLESEITTWEPDGYIIASRVYEDFTRFGPRKMKIPGLPDTDWQWNAAGELEESSGPAGAWKVLTRDALGRPLTSKDTVRDVTHTFAPNGLSTTHTASAGSANHTWTATRNGFGEIVSSGFTGPQPIGGTSGWDEGVFTSTGDNDHTKAATQSTFNEQTLESVFRANTAAGFKSSVTFETLNGVPCLLVEASALTPGLDGGSERSLQRTYIDGLGRVHRVQTPDPSAAGLVWQNHDTHFDAQGRPNRLTRPGQPDILIEYDTLGRVHRRVLDYNGNGQIDPGTDWVLQSDYGVVDGKWRESAYLLGNGGTPHLLSRSEANAATRFFSSQIGGQAPDEYQLTFSEPGEFTLKLNNRVVLNQTPLKLTVQDSRISETNFIGEFELNLSPLGVPVDASLFRGPRADTFDFNDHAETSAHDDGLISKTFVYDHQEGAVSKSEVKIGGETVVERLSKPLELETEIGGTGELAHGMKVFWNEDHSTRVERTASGDSKTTWTLNPSGNVTLLEYPDGMQEHYSYNAAGNTTEASSTAGTRIWEYDPHTARLKKGKLGAETVFEILERDAFGRILEFEDASGVRTFTPNNTHWTPGHEEWTSGPLSGVRFERVPDERGRPGTFSIKLDGELIHQEEYQYQGDSNHLDRITVQAPGLTESAEIRYSGPAGLADRVEFRSDDTLVFFQEILRDTAGHPEALFSGPGSPYNASWTLDDRGRLQTLTRPWGEYTHGYDPFNGTLASISGPGDNRQFVVNDRGELAGVVIDGQPLAVHPDVNLSGAVSFQENRRQFRIQGQAHADAEVRVYLNDILFATLPGGPFSVLVDENNWPAMGSGATEIAWRVTGERPGPDYIGGMAIADLEGHVWLPPAQEHFVFDAHGRRERDGLRVFEWNAAGQIVGIRNEPEAAGVMTMGGGNLPAGLRVVNRYDAAGRRFEKRVYDGETLLRTHLMKYEGFLPKVEKVIPSVPGGPRYTNTYSWGAGSEGVMSRLDARLHIVFHRPEGGMISRNHVVYDPKGRVMALRDGTTGNEVARYRYDEVTGRLLGEHGPRSGMLSLLYNTMYYDRETETYAMGSEVYCTRTGQMLRRDPLEVNPQGVWGDPPARTMRERAEPIVKNAYTRPEVPREKMISTLGAPPRSHTTRFRVFENEEQRNLFWGTDTTSTPRRARHVHPPQHHPGLWEYVKALEQGAEEGLGRAAKDIGHGVQHQGGEMLHVTWELTGGALNHKFHHEPTMYGQIGEGVKTLATSPEARHALAAHKWTEIKATFHDPDLFAERVGGGALLFLTGEAVFGAMGTVARTAEVAEEAAVAGRVAARGERVMGGITETSVPRLGLPFEPRWSGMVQPYKKGVMSPIEHIMYRHGPDSGFANVGRFAEGTGTREIKAMVNEAARFGETTFRPSGRGQIIYDFGRQIGTHMDGSAATRLQVFFNEAGEIMTAFPIR